MLEIAEKIKSENQVVFRLKSPIGAIVITIHKESALTSKVSFQCSFGRQDISVNNSRLKETLQDINELL